jgi:hypothetical protein
MKSDTVPKLGVIDSISAGFRVVGRFPWLALFPIALDVLLWLGPRLSLRPLVPLVLALLQLPPDAPLPPDYATMVESSRAMLTQLGDGYNLGTVLANSLLGLPSVAAAQGDLPALAGLGEQFELTTVGAALGWAALLGTAGIFLGALYLVSISQVLRTGKFTGPGFFASYGRATARLFGLVLLVILALLLLSLPMAFMTGLLTLFGGGFGTVLALLLIVIAGWWIRLALTFTVEAIVLDEVGIRHAIYRSINVALRNFWSTAGLIILISLITTGFGLVWARLVTIPFGVPLSIVLNAVIGTGLIVSPFLFYHNRYRLLVAALTPPGSSA